MAAALSALSSEEPLVVALRILSGTGPMAIAVALTCATRDFEGRSDYWRRVVDFRRIRPEWYVVILLLAPAVMGVAAL
jgi:hypothetical protein